MRRLYHFTKKENLESIYKNGLCPKNGEHSKAVDDEDNVVCYSENFEGAIGINMSIEEKYKSEKEKNNKAFYGENVIEYLGENVYLSFDGEGIDNLSENNANGFFNGKT